VNKDGFVKIPAAFKQEKLNKTLKKLLLTLQSNLEETRLMFCIADTTPTLNGLSTKY
jgi:hypothetical protein